MPSEQPREGTRVDRCRCGFPFYEDRFTIPQLDGGSVPDAWKFCPYCSGRLDEPAQPQPRGEKARVADPTPCDRCGNPIGIVWFADNSLFNEITGTVGVGMLCPTCFDHLAAPRLLTWKAAPVGEQELAAPPRGEEARVSARATSTKEDG